MVSDAGEIADYVQVQRTLDEMGIDAGVAEEGQGVTTPRAADLASSIEITLGGGITAEWHSFCIRLARRLAEQTLRGIFDRNQVTVTDGLIWAEIGPEVPAEAITELADPPEAPSSKLVWDRGDHRWKDLFE